MSDSHLEARLPHSRGKTLLLAGAVVCLIVLMFWRTGQWMIVRWEQPNSYYGHGWLIPPVAAFLLYLRRKQIAACPRMTCPAGLIVLIPALLVHLVGTRLQVGFLSGFALLGVLAGFVLTLFGPRMLRLTAFPILFLAFMVPVPAVLIETVSFRMKLLAARVATTLVDLLGVVAVRQGSHIRVAAGALIVDDVCSGLKYLISLTAFGALYAHISRLRFWGKATIFLLSVPIAFVANVLRVMLMVLSAEAWGVETVEQWYFHDLFGFLLFISAFLCLFLVESALSGELGVGFLGRRREAVSDGEADDLPPDDPGPNRAPDAHRPGGILRGATFAVMAGAALLSVYLYWPRPVPAEQERLASIPINIGEWSGRDFALDDRTLEILGTRDVLSRSYSNGRENVQLLIVLARQARRRTHPPEQCLTGEGYSIEASRPRTVSLSGEGRSDRDLPVQELILNRADRHRVVWYFYKSGDRLSTSYWSHQIGVVLRKLANPDAADILIRAETNFAGGDTEGGRQRLSRFLSLILPQILTQLP